MSTAKKTSKTPAASKKSKRLEVDDQPLKGGTVLHHPPPGGGVQPIPTAPPGRGPKISPINPPIKD